MKHWIFISLVFASSIAFATQDVELGCKHLRVVLDARLSPDVVEHEWGSGNPRSETPAKLELIGCEGQLLDRLVLDAPLAQLDPIPIRGAPNPTYLVSTDLTAEAGSYNGPLTIPIQVIRDHLIAAVARFADKHIVPIHLALTGKASWRRVSHHNGDNLFSVSCQPKRHGFVTFYRHYFLSHQEWKVKVRKRDGLWESDGEFPSRNAFP